MMVNPDNDGSPITLTNNPVVPKYNNIPPVMGVTHGAIWFGMELKNEEMDDRSWYDSDDGSSPLSEMCCDWCWFCFNRTNAWPLVAATISRGVEYPNVYPNSKTPPTTVEPIVDKNAELDDDDTDDSVMAMVLAT